VKQIVNGNVAGRVLEKASEDAIIVTPYGDKASFSDER
jgi:hypothetical protein